jgi:hypothetical protein
MKMETLRMPPLKALALINDLHSIDLQTADFFSVKNKVSSLLIYTPIYFSHTVPGEVLYRGVIYPQRPLQTRLLGAPPSEMVKDFQRCNGPNNPKFYCSVFRSTVFHEINAVAGDVVYLSTWRIKKKFGTRVIQNRRNHNADVLSNAINTFTESVFKRNIDRAFSFQYKLSAAFADFFTDQQGTPSYPQPSALTYPSVAHNFRAENLAIAPSAVNECLELEAVEELRFISIKGEMVEAEIFNHATSFRGGVIEWKGYPSIRRNANEVIEGDVHQEPI